MSAGSATLSDVAGFDADGLVHYLKRRLAGFDDPGTIQFIKFSGGQSNPTFRVETPAGRYVLRKKPAGKLLPSAHAIEREYKVMHALQGQVPVPKMLLLCEDESIIGQVFYLMEHVEGRIFHDARMLEAERAERRALCLELTSVLARLHNVDYHAAGLDDFGRTGGYVARQLERLTKQYVTSRIEPNADMDRVIPWLEQNLPETDESSIVHGDYRSYNVLYAPREPRIVAILDWELSTIGHPLADLAFLCLPYHMEAEDLRGFRGTDAAELGIPSEQELIAQYCREAGRDELPQLRYFIVFSLFRSAAIRAGVYKRAFDGTAADARAKEAGGRYRQAAAAAAGLIHDTA